MNKWCFVIFVFTFIFYQRVPCQQVIWQASGGANVPSSWQSINKNTTEPIEKSGFWLLEAGQIADTLITQTADVSQLTSLFLSYELASFGSGALNPLRIELSYDTGKTFRQVFQSLLPENGSNYIADTLLIPSCGSGFTLRFSPLGTQGRGVRLRNIRLVARDYSIDFEGSGETKTAYSAGNVTLNGKNWSLEEALIGTSSSDLKIGARALRLRGYTQSAFVLQEDLLNGLDSVFFTYWAYETDNQAVWKLEYSTDQGVTWSGFGPVFSANAPNTAYTYKAALGVDSPLRIRILPSSGTNASTNRRMTIDNLLFTDIKYSQPSKPQLVGIEQGSAHVRLHFKPLQKGEDERIVVYSRDASAHFTPTGNGRNWRGGVFNYLAQEIDSQQVVLAKGSDSLIEIRRLPTGQGFLSIRSRSGRKWSDSLWVPIQLHAVEWAGTGSASAWYTQNNWSPPMEVSHWKSSDYIVFSNSNSVTSCGINMATASLSIGGIGLLSNRNTALQIGNSSQTSAGVLGLNGVTWEKDTSNVLLNFSKEDLSIIPSVGTGNQSMQLQFSPVSTFRIDSSGSIVIGVGTTGLTNTFHKKGKGSGILRFTATNSSTLKFVNEEGRTQWHNPQGQCFSPEIVLILEGGELRVSSSQTVKKVIIKGGVLHIDSGVLFTVRDTFWALNGSLVNHGTMRYCGHVHITDTFQWSLCRNLALDSQAVIKLTRDLHVVDTLFLIHGGLELGNNHLSAKRVEVQRATQYIKTEGNGMLTLTDVGPSPVVFPVGNLFPNYLTLSNQTGQACSFSVRVYDSVTQNGQKGGVPIINKSLPITWDIRKSGTQHANDGSGVDFEFSFQSQQIPNNFSATGFYHYAQGDWNFEGDGQIDYNQGRFVFSTYKGGFSPFSIQSSMLLTQHQMEDILLFHYDSLDNHVTCKLENRNENYPIDSIVIYHIHALGIKTKIGRLDTLDSLIHRPYWGANRYWAAFYNRNEVIHASTPFVVERKPLQEVVVFPNPVLDRFYIRIEHPDDYVYKMLTPLGQTVKTGQIGIGDSHFEINMEAMLTGYYFLLISNDTMSWKFKILKN